jgi:hypothetical protein
MFEKLTNEERRIEFRGVKACAAEEKVENFLRSKSYNAQHIGREKIYFCSPTKSRAMTNSSSVIWGRKINNKMMKFFIHMCDLSAANTEVN